MKRYTDLLAFLLIFCNTASGRDTVRIGTFTLPPFMMEAGEDKRTAGVAVEFWKKHIAPQMDVEIEAFGPLPISRAQKMLEDGDIDLIPNMTRVPEREKKFIFPEVPLSEITTCIGVLKKSPLITVTSQKDLLNLRVVFLEKAFIPPILKHETIHFEIVSGADYFQRFMEMVEGGRTDAFLHINYFSLMYELKLFGKKDAYRIIPLPVDKEKVYCIFTRSQRGMRLSKQFNEINAPLFKSRVYDRLAEEMIR